MACRCGLDLHFVPDIVRCCHRGCSSHSCRCPARLQAPGHCKREHPMHPCSAFASKQGTDPTADGSPEVPMSVWWQAIQVGISAGGARRCLGAASPRKLCTGSAAIHTNFADAQVQPPPVCHLLLPLPSPLPLHSTCASASASCWRWPARWSCSTRRQGLDKRADKGSPACATVLHVACVHKYPVPALPPPPLRPPMPCAPSAPRCKWCAWAWARMWLLPWWPSCRQGALLGLAGAQRVRGTAPVRARAACTSHQ